MHEIIVDLFAGGGGASKGIEDAIGRSPDVAVNHDAEAITMHIANHPATLHLCEDVWGVDPAKVCQSRPVGLLWASPDCKHFSKAKGGAVKRSKEIRSLAWVVVKWARDVRPRVIILENVEEFQSWGPLDDEGRPDATKKGETFAAWLAALRAAGYAVEWKELRACDFGAPTTRKRLFLIARCDGQPIVWPSPTHGLGRAPYRTAAECIDWTIPVPSIFDRKRPLAEKTLRRIARGIRRYVLETSTPFVVGNMAPTLVQTGYGEREGQAPRALDLHAPLGTVVAGGAKHALVCAFLAKHYGGNETPGSSLAKPFDTVTCKDHHALVCAFLTKYYGTSIGEALDAPLGTVCAGAQHYGLVTVAGESHAIVDIGMRMLEPRELFRAQGFPDSYVINPTYRGKPMTKTAQVRMCGNSVSPAMSRALAAANFNPQPAQVAA